MTDPIADMLTRIRNAQAVNKKNVNIPASKIKSAISQVLLDEGYIDAIDLSQNKRTITLGLKYYQNKAVIDSISRVSRPGLRVYASKDKMPSVIGGMGIVVVSTSKGVMTGQQANKDQVGGEVLCQVY